jgi:predicted nucleic acid-binding protein
VRKFFFKQVKIARLHTYPASRLVSLDGVSNSFDIAVDDAQALLLESWLESIFNDYAFNILGFEADAVQVWGRLRVQHHENAIDKQIATMAMVNGLTLVTRHISDFQGLPLTLKNPFE